MRTIQWLLTAFSIGILLSVAGCKDDDPIDPINETIKLGPNTTWISEATAELLVVVDSVQVVFQGSSSELDDQQVGDIIVSGIAPNAPYGYLRQITQKQKISDQYIFQTVDVSLSEAFEELNVSYSQTFTPGDTLTGKAEDVRFNVDFPDVVIYDVDGNESTTADQVKLSGSISFVPKIDVIVNISQFQLQHAKVEGAFETELSSSLTVGGSIGLISGTITVYQMPLTPFTLPGTPIVIVPFLRVKLGASGSASISIEGTVSNNNTVSAFLEFNNGAWLTGYSRNMNNSYEFSGLTGTVNAKGYVEPGIDFKFFGSNWAKGSVTTQGYLKFKADLIPDPTCTLKAGVSAGVNAKLQIFGTGFGAAAYPELFSHEELLFTCSDTGTSNPPIAAFTASSTSITTGQPVNFTDQSTGGPTSWSWTFQGGTPASSASQNPSGISYSTAGIYDVALTVSNNNGSDTRTMNGYIIVTQQGGGIVTNPGGGVTDIDGNSYQTIVLGNGQEWMAENLRTGSYRNGDPIITGLSNNEWFNTSTGAYANYNSNPSYDAVYGKLYNWHAVGDLRNVCPVDWHIPTDGEWSSFTDYLGGINVAGGKMKTTGTIQTSSGLWESPNSGATNESGFSGIPGGTRNSNGQFEYIGYNGYYWSVTEDGWNNAWYRPLNSNDDNTSHFSYFKNMGFSVRCMKD